MQRIQTDPEDSKWSREVELIDWHRILIGGSLISVARGLGTRGWTVKLDTVVRSVDST